ncbi:Regulator of chromosome condensation (RCC1) repeat [Pseudoscourfieldia marina]
MNDYGQAPTDGVAGNFVAIAAGGNHSMALRRDGSIQCWGFNGNGQAPPGGVVGKFSVEFSSVIESG